MSRASCPLKFLVSAKEAAEAIDKGLAKALLDCWVNF